MKLLLMLPLIILFDKNSKQTDLTTSKKKTKKKESMEVS